jgi:hypothetical protein
MTMKSVMVIGTTFAFPLLGYGAVRRAADMVGRALAGSGFGLVTGNPPGVDSIAAGAFWAECKRLGRTPDEAYRQLWLPQFSRGYWMPGRGFDAPPRCVCKLDRTETWLERAMDLTGAVIMVGGRRRGSLRIAHRFIDAGKPVLPIPFVGGESRKVFEEILRTWVEAPVPGLSQAQFLRLAVPWISDTGPLVNLLLGTLAETKDIFISYRRDDSGMAAGRLNADLVDHFGDHRVFFDLHGIEPADRWMPTIEEAIDACKVGIVVIGPQFLAPAEDGQARLHDPHDVVRKELTQLIGGRKAILPVLIGGARLPTEDQLPEPLKPLLESQALSLDNRTWATTVRAILDAIEKLPKQLPPA